MNEMQKPITKEIVSRPQSEIVMICMVVCGMLFYFLSGSLVYTVATMASVLTVAGIIALIAAIFTKNWGYVFAVIGIVWMGFAVYAFYAHPISF